MPDDDLNNDEHISDLDYQISGIIHSQKILRKLQQDRLSEVNIKILPCHEDIAGVGSIFGIKLSNDFIDYVLNKVEEVYGVKRNKDKIVRAIKENFESEQNAKPMTELAQFFDERAELIYAFPAIPYVRGQLNVDNLGCKEGCQINLSFVKDMSYLLIALYDDSRNTEGIGAPEWELHWQVPMRFRQALIHRMKIVYDPARWNALLKEKEQKFLDEKA